MTATEINAKRQQREKKSLNVIDTDIHHGFHDDEDLFPYLSKIHRQRLIDFGLINGGVYLMNGGNKGRRADTLDPNDPKDSETTALNPHEVKQNLLDECDVDIAILTGAQTYTTSCMTELDYATALCRAFNDFTIDRWLSFDDRFRGTIAICTQDPQGAVEEIDRLGDRPDIVAVMMPCGAQKPFGHRFYRPIYEACIRHNLTVALHFGGEGIGINSAPTPAGYPSYYAESRFARPSAYQVHLASFIFEGVFETFPTLKVAMLESGFAWIPPFVWRMDADWKGLRYQTPWVKKAPSEYIYDHVRFASQPVDDPPNQKSIESIVEWMQGEKTLMFSSDHPHWDWDDPRNTFTTFDPELRRRIMVDNAIDAFPKLA